MLINDPKQLGKFIKTLRKRMGVTQKDLALSAGTGLRFIVDLEKGKPTCHVGKVFSALKMLGVNLNAIPPAGFNVDDQQTEK